MNDTPIQKIKIDNFLDEVYSRKSKEWTKIAEKKLLQDFKEASKKVLAYKNFLNTFSINPVTIRTQKDFVELPSVTKKNYLRVSKWEELCKQNSLVKEALVMTSTSGSTGAPFYFPRVTDIDIQSSVSHQLFLRTSRINYKKTTLVIDCFGMGVWIGGLLTYQAFKHISEQGYPMTIITPGMSKNEIFQALKNLGPSYEQIILCGYPPFIKDLVDDGKGAGIMWENYNLKIIFAAESFSETFRDYFTDVAGIKDIHRDTMNIYGSADLGTMAAESPLCILIRRLALTNNNLYTKLFGQATRLPTFAQYIPEFINFEANNNSIFCTGDNVLPLIRYEIGDHGGVLTYTDVEDIFKSEGMDLQKEARKVGIEDTITELPFVYVYERSDFAASFYGAIMYPEFFKKGLLSKELREYVTGKFTMSTKNDKDENQYLEINIELKAGQKVTASLRSQTRKALHTTLLSQSTEYAKLFQYLGDRIHPKLVFWPYGHAEHFFTGGKQKWVK